jgi:hypothetical protein
MTAFVITTLLVPLLRNIAPTATAASQRLARYRPIRRAAPTFRRTIQCRAVRSKDSAG